jgi:creatinine amidohydrolase/Fe(II)-dependent formamide hydrolase-like protein
MQDILARLTEQGYRLIVVFTGHYPKVQGALLWRVAEEHMKANPAIRVMVLDPFDLHPTDPHGEHAGRLETSVMLYLKPELVDMEQLKQPGALRAITPDGAQATVEYGRERFTAILKELVTTVRKALCEP